MPCSFAGTDVVEGKGGEEDQGGWESALVPQELAGQRLDRVAAALFPRFSRTQLRAVIDRGGLRIPGLDEPPKPRTPVPAGVRLHLRPPADDAPRQVAARADISLRTVHEDEHLLVIDKPAGLVAHPAAGHADDTLVNALVALDPQLAALPRAGLVHRLDKDTTGLLLVARTEGALRGLQEMLRRRDIERTYRVLVRGRPLAGGEIVSGIMRHPRQRKRMMAVPEGTPGARFARSRYVVRERYRDHVELEVSLDTGRTHQVRVHLQSVGLPVVGDPDYGGRLAIPAGAGPGLERALRTAKRQMLHAWQLRLEHPLEGVPLHLQADVPADYERLRALLQANAD